MRISALILMVILTQISCRAVQNNAELESISSTAGGRLTPPECVNVMQGLGMSPMDIQSVSDRRICSCEDYNNPYRTEFHYLACLKAYGVYRFTIPESFTYVNDTGDLDSTLGMTILRRDVIPSANK